jgi:hypothetical protein
MSDDNLILSMVAAIGLVAVAYTPALPDPRWGSPDHYIGCNADGLAVRGTMFDGGVSVAISCPDGEGVKLGPPPPEPRATNPKWKAAI